MPLFIIIIICRYRLFCIITGILALLAFWHTGIITENTENIINIIDRND